MRIIFKSVNILLALGLIFIAIAVAYIAFPQFGNQALIVRSGSMSPAIQVGSIVVARPPPLRSGVIGQARPAENATYKKEDIIAFRSEKNSKTIITHRVVDIETGKDGTFYKTKGDANEEEDGWLVSDKNVLGKVNFTIPWAGKLLAFAKSDIGFLLLIAIPAGFVIVLETWSIINEIRKNRKNKNFGFVINNSMPRKRRLLGFKLLIPLIIIAGIAIPGTYAFLNDTETSTGNVFQAASVFPTATPTPTPIPIANHLVINEVLPNPPNSNACGSENDAEWVEIYNPTGGFVNLDTWAIGDDLFTDDLPNVSLPAGSFAVVSDCLQSSFTAIWTLPGGTIYIDLPSAIGNGLANGGEEIRLFNGATLIDNMSFGTNTDAFSPSVTAPAASHSAERDPDGVDTNTKNDFVDRSSPSPGS